MVDIAFVIAGIDLAVGIAILFFASAVLKKTEGGALYWVAFLYLATAVTYVIHAGVELAGLGEGLYAMTALVATVTLGFTMVLVDIITHSYGGSNE